MAHPIILRHAQRPNHMAQGSPQKSLPGRQQPRRPPMHGMPRKRKYSTPGSMQPNTEQILEPTHKHPHANGLLCTTSAMGKRGLLAPRKIRPIPRGGQTCGRNTLPGLEMPLRRNSQGQSGRSNPLLRTCTQPRVANDNH